MVDLKDTKKLSQTGSRSIFPKEKSLVNVKLSLYLTSLSQQVRT